MPVDRLPANVVDAALPSLRRLWLVLVTLLAGLLLSAWAYVALLDLSRGRERALLEEQVAARAGSLQRLLDRAIGSLNSVRAYQTADGVEDAERFRRFVVAEAGFHDGTRALGWATYVPHAERAAFESRLRMRGEGSLGIFEDTGYGALTRVPERDVYFPANFIIALSGGDISPGLDLAAPPWRGQAIERAVKSGRPAATKLRLSSVWTDRQEQVFQAFLPVYADTLPVPVADGPRSPGDLDVADRRDLAGPLVPPVGLAMGVFSLTALTTQVFDAERDDFDIWLFDPAAAPVERFLYALRDRGDNPMFEEVRERFIRDGRGVERRVHVADREWLLYALPRADAGAVLLPLAGLAAGVALTGLLAVYLFIALTRGLQVSRLNRELAREQVDAAVQRTIAREAQATAAARTSFLARASHDLRQPLHALGLYLAHLQGNPDAARDAEFMRRLRDSADGLAELFEATLDIGRLESGALAPERRTLAIGPWLQTLLGEQTAMAEAQGVLLTLAGDPHSMADTDPLLCGRIVRNLVGNALSHASPRHIELRVTTRRDRVDLRVTDDGRGISRADRDRLFAPFERGGASDGAGLGLAIVRELAAVLDIRVRLRSRLGRGSVFCLSLPIACATQDPAALANSQAIAPDSSRRVAPRVERWQEATNTPVASPAPWLAGLNVLIVDDDPTVLDATARIVEGWGASVRRAGSLAEARAMLGSGLPDRLLVDYSLPDGAGGDLARSWQSATGRRAVVITGEALTDDMRDLLVVRKPLTALKLRTALESVAVMESATAES